MLLKEKVAIARKLAAEALEKFDFLDVGIEDCPAGATEHDHIDIVNIVNNALAAEVRGK